MIAKTLLAAASDHIPVKKYSPHLKPGWTPELSTAHNRSKRAYKIWIAAGRPRRSDHPLRKSYKEAKANFRSKLRALQKKQRDDFFQNLDLNCHDSGKLFRLIRRHNGVTTEPTSILAYNGCTYTGEELPKLWGEYFAKLSTPASPPSNTSFHQSIREQYLEMLADSSPEPIVFTLEEVSEAVRSLKTNKAAGPDELDPEHLTAAPNRIV